MSQAMAIRDQTGIMERAVIQGDLSELNSAERVDYYRTVCESLGLNPYTKPFEYLSLDNGDGGKKLVLYARKDCTEQLRDIKKVSITRLERERTQDLYIVTAHAVLPDGRTDSAVGAVAIAKEGGYWEDVKGPDGKPVMGDKGKIRRRFVPDGTYVSLSGDALANAIMKAETKAKRRVTLSICGLGITDESEIDSIPGSRIVEVDLPQEPPVDVVSNADEQLWKNWLKALAKAQDLGINAPEIRLPIARDTLKERGAEIIRAIRAREKQLAEQEAAAAQGRAAHQAPTAAEKAAPRDETTGEVLDDAPTLTPAEVRSNLWAENRRLVAEAQARGIQGRTLNNRSGDDVLVAANTELAARIREYDRNQQAYNESMAV